MKKENNSYLVKEDLIDGTLEYFDFETMSFTSEKKRPVAISTIDALTTLFESEHDL